MALLLTAVIAILFPLAARRFDRHRPGGVQNFLEMLVSFLRGLVAETVGEGHVRQYLPIIGGIFVFIAMGNLFGLFFFLQPPTGSFGDGGPRDRLTVLQLRGTASTAGRLPEALHGAAHLIAPFFVIEIIGTFARILSLSLRPS
jgi:F-type H+-transporting ATPase subunit a